MGVFRMPRATTAQRTGITPAVGELVYDTDLDQIYQGDGVTVGGVPISGSGDVETQEEGVTVDATASIIDFVGGMVEATGGAGTTTVHVSIPEVTSDPGSPADGDAWVLKTGGGSGLGFGLLPFMLLLGGGGGGATYSLSYKTVSDGIVRVALS